MVDIFHVNVSTHHLFNLCESEQTEILLGKRPSIFIDEGELYKLREICARVWQILAYEPELHFVFLYLDFCYSVTPFPFPLYFVNLQRDVGK